MKKITFIALAVIFSFLGLSQQAQAQFQQGDVLINGGVSLGLWGYNWGSGYSRAGGIPAITANVEYSLDDRFAIGPYIGYFARNYNERWGGSNTYKHRFSAFAFGVRGTAHATDLINDWFDASIDEDKLDIYGAAQLGYEVYSLNYDEALPIEPVRSSGGINLGLILGARYNFNEQVGAYLEFGRGTFGLATLGVSLKL